MSPTVDDFALVILLVEPGPLPPGIKSRDRQSKVCDEPTMFSWHRVVPSDQDPLLALKGLRKNGQQLVIL